MSIISVAHVLYRLTQCVQFESRFALSGSTFLRLDQSQLYDMAMSTYISRKGSFDQIAVFEIYCLVFSKMFFAVICY